jgi:catalase (peroxidase I)
MLYFALVPTSARATKVSSTKTVKFFQLVNRRTKWLDDSSHKFDLYGYAESGHKERLVRDFVKVMSADRIDLK